MKFDCRARIFDYFLCWTHRQTKELSGPRSALCSLILKDCRQKKNMILRIILSFVLCHYLYHQTGTTMTYTYHQQWLTMITTYAPTMVFLPQEETDFLQTWVEIRSLSKAIWSLWSISFHTFQAACKLFVWALRVLSWAWDMKSSTDSPRICRVCCRIFLNNQMACNGNSLLWWKTHTVTMQKHKMDLLVGNFPASRMNGILSHSNSWAAFMIEDKSVSKALGSIIGVQIKKSWEIWENRENPWNFQLEFQLWLFTWSPRIPWCFHILWENQWFFFVGFKIGHVTCFPVNNKFVTWFWGFQ